MDPTSGAILPASHKVHVELPDWVEYEPREQFEHDEAATPENKPGSHFWQYVAFEDECLPALQMEQIVDAGLCAKNPPGHRTHAVAPPATPEPSASASSSVA